MRFILKEIIKKLVLVILFLFYRVRLVGIKNIPSKGAAILCSNHIGEMDMFLIGYRLKRLVRWVAKEELFRNPIFGAFITSLGAVPIKRGKGDVGAAKLILKMLSQGEIVGIFPEGTRTRGKDLKDVKVMPGAALFAHKANVPIIPVAIEGKYKLFSRIYVTFGEPFYLEFQNDTKYTTEEFAEFSKTIMKKIYGMMEEK